MNILKVLIRLCSCHVQADLHIFESRFSFDYMKAGNRLFQNQVDSSPYNKKKLFSNGTLHGSRGG